MKKGFIFVFSMVFLFSISAYTSVLAEADKERVVTILKTEADVTGDGKNEKIYLKGVPYQDENSYLKEIYIEISASNGKNFKIALGGGSKASLELVDINHDGVKDLFANVLTGGSGGITINYLYSLKNFAVTNLTVPDPIETESRFLNNYQAEIILSETGKRYLFNLIDRKKYYKKIGLYYKGKLNEPTELMVHSFNSLIPIQLNADEIGLKGIQMVSGVANADTIANIESIWVNKEGKWKLVNADVKKELIQN